jgi:hypothetical protein
MTTLFRSFKCVLLIFLVFAMQFVVLAQSAESVHNQIFRTKINELYAKYKTEGFVTFKRGDIKMERNMEMPVHLTLTEGSWYEFIVVGDPEASKFEMKLGMAGIGDIITDKFRNNRTGEFWTTFSFICPRSGSYLMTFFQRGHTKKLLGHVAVMQRPRVTANGIYTFK